MTLPMAHTGGPQPGKDGAAWASLPGARAELSRLAVRLREASRDDTLLPFAMRHATLYARFSAGRLGVFQEAIPQLRSRYLREYLSLDLGVADRRAVLMFHHELLARRFTAEAVREVLDDTAELWTLTVDDRRHVITMRADKSLYGEGDLILELKEDGVCISDMSFSIAPGRIAGVGEGAAILITRLQGRPKQFAAIQRTTKACGDISPGHVLLAAIEGVAVALSVQTLCGVSTAQQLSTRWGIATFDYDAFWSDLTVERHGEWYRTPAPIPRKPLSDVSASHRRRTKRKRRVKAEIAEQVGAAITARLRG